MKNRFSFIVTSAIACAFVLATGCSRQEKTVEANTPALPTVAVAKAMPQDMSRDLVLTAEFKPFQEIDVMAKVAGYIKQINVDIGDRVKEGQLLATLEIPEMADDKARAQATLERSQAEVSRARDDLQRAQSAHDIAHLSYDRLAKVMKDKPGLVAQQEVDDAHSRDLVAEAQVASGKSNITAAEQQVHVARAELEKVATLFNYTKVTAPFTGIITKRFANTGSMIQAGTSSQTQAMPVVRLSENTLLRLILPVPESVVPSVRLGARVEVKVPSLKQSFPGKVVRFEGRLNVDTRTMETEVDVQNPSLVLMPGMYAEVNLNLDRRTGTLAIPVTALDLDSEASSSAGQRNRPASGHVMVVLRDNKLERRTVTVGLETANRAEILSGLSDGELVVVGNRSGLEPGQSVKPKITTLTARDEEPK
jgi:RND family efflux transporter MFP subunit